MSLIKVTSGFARILRSPLQIFKALPLWPQEQTKGPGRVQEEKGELMQHVLAYLAMEKI